MVEESLEWSLIKTGIEFGIGGVGDGRGKFRVELIMGGQ